VGLVVVAVAAVWLLTPIRHYLDLETLAKLGRRLRVHPLAPLLVLGGFLVAALLFFPITVLLAATALVFDPLRGLIYGFVSALAAAVLTYGIGRLLGDRGRRWLSGPRLGRVRDQLQSRGLLAIITARLMPIGNFSVFNLAAGMLAIRWRDFLIGNIIGLLPAIVVLTFFAGRLETVLRWLGR
jgi:phospholipase D1/2